MYHQIEKVLLWVLNKLNGIPSKYRCKNRLQFGKRGPKAEHILLARKIWDINVAQILPVCKYNKGFIPPKLSI